MDKEKHQAMREELMSEEDIKLTDKYLDYFRSSWMDKERRGLFDKWEKSDAYWEGETNQPESDDDPGSNTNIVNPNVEGQVALCAEPEISLQCDPIEPSDDPFTEHARVIGQFIIDRNKMKRKIDMSVRRLKKFGMAIFTCLFNPELLDGMGLPWFKSWNPAYVFFDPSITDIYEINQGRFVIFICNKSKYWAEEEFGEELASIIVPGYHPIESEWLFDETEGTEATDNYMHMFVFTMKKGKVRLVQMSGCGVKLWDSNDKNIKFPDKQYPVFATPDMAREGTIYAKATSELLWDGSDLINDLDDQIRVNARLSGNIQKVVGTASGIDIDKWTNEAGLNIPAADPNAWKMVQPPQMPQYIFDRRNMALFQERSIQTRFSDQMTGIQQRGVDTATEALALQQSGLAGIDHTKLLLQETMSEMVEYALEVGKENWTSEQAFRITGKNPGFLWYKASGLKKIPKMVPVSVEYISKFKMANPDLPIPEFMQATREDGEPIYKDAKFDMKVSIGAGIPQNKAFRYTAAKEAFISKAITTPEYRKKLRDMGVIPDIGEDEQQIVSTLEAMQQKMPATGGMPNMDINGLSASGSPEQMQTQGGGNYGQS